MDEQPRPAAPAAVSRAGAAKHLTSAGFMLAAALAGAVWAAAVVLTLTPAVDAAGYLAGAGASGTFTAAGYSTQCSSNSTTGTTCWTDTAGYLEPGDAAATWPGEVQPGTTFPVRLPVWNWGPGTPPLFDTAMAIFVGLTCAVIQLLCWGGLGYTAFRRIKSGTVRVRWR